MIRSFHYAAYEPLLKKNFREEFDDEDQEKWADAWYYYATRFYLNGYIDTIKNTSLIPQNKDDYRVVLETFLLEKALLELINELKMKSNRSLVALRGIKTILDS